ncbi:MAG: transposase, partial [Geminicoccaceae bacterium]
ELGHADRRNSCYHRWLLTELGAIELAVPRTRTFSALRVVRAYARRARDVDRMILACFLLGLSTRKCRRTASPLVDGPAAAGGGGNHVGAQAIDVLADLLAIRDPHERVPAGGD